MNKIKTFEDFKSYSQLLTAHRLLHEYLELEFVLSEIKETTICKFSNLEPESFAEGWLKHNIAGADEEWINKAFSYFIELLIGYKYKD